MKPELPHEERRPQQPDQEQAEGNNDSATDEVQLVAVGEQQLSERRRTGTQQNEDGREAENEAGAKPHCRQALRRQHFFRSAKAVSRFSRSPIDLTIAGRSTYLGSRVSRSDCDDNGGYERTSGGASRGYRDYRGQDPDWWHVLRLLRQPDRENDPGVPGRDIGSGQIHGRARGWDFLRYAPSTFSCQGNRGCQTRKAL